MDARPLALALWALYGAVAFGFRMWLQIRATGESGFKGISGSPGSLEWCAGVLFAVAIAGGVVAAAIDLDSLEGLDSAAVRLVGAALYAVGLAGTLYAQLAMGTSWRIGVDEGERTELVTAGPFGFVRNPIYSAMLPAVLGLVLLVPNALALAAFTALFVSLEVQVRFVEEPYLVRTHGERYRAYAARVGRFVPGVGRLGA